MRAQEFIVEVVTLGGNSPDAQWSKHPDLDTYRSRGVEIGKWKDSTGADISNEFRKNFQGQSGQTNIKFNRTDASGSPTMGISGTAGSQSPKIFGDVLNNLKTWLDNNPDQSTLKFRSEEPSRTSLYSKIVDRLAPQMGMIGTKTDLGNGAAEFSLSKAKPGEVHTPVSTRKARGETPLGQTRPAGIDTTLTRSINTVGSHYPSDSRVLGRNAAIPIGGLPDLRASMPGFNFKEGATK